MYQPGRPRVGDRVSIAYRVALSGVIVFESLVSPPSPYCFSEDRESFKVPKIFEVQSLDPVSGLFRR